VKEADPDSKVTQPVDSDRDADSPPGRVGLKQLRRIEPGYGT